MVIVFGFFLKVNQVQLKRAQVDVGDEEQPMQSQEHCPVTSLFIILKNNFH